MGMVTSVYGPPDPPGPPGPPAFPARGARTSAFTLIEVLAAVLLTSIVLTAAVSIFINISNATSAATERMRQARHAIALLDRVAHDLESAYLLVKAEDQDPIDHPWIFLGESRYGGGSDRLKFIMRNHQRRSSEGHASDLATVTYALVQDDPESFNLVRSSTEGLPDGLDREIPLSQADGAMLLAEGLKSFSVRFMGQKSGWRSEWDSSQQGDSGTTPMAAEITIALVDSPVSYKRKVAIPMRPVPLQLTIEEYVNYVRSGQKARDEEAENDPNKPSEKFSKGACKSTFAQCLQLPANEAKFVKEKGQEAYQACFGKLPQVCFEEFPGSTICGVSLNCK